MNENRVNLLGRRALSIPLTSADLMMKVQAMDDLIQADVPIPLDDFRQHLEAVLANDFGTYQSARAASMAARLLEIMDGDPEAVFPSETPDALAPDDYWPGPSDPFSDLCTHDTQGLRDEWRESVEGPPPWRKKPLSV